MIGNHFKVIRDPIYGYIGVTEKELSLISMPVFQRLRRISQLSFADYVYPNANHTRFSHVLGTMAVAKKVAEYLDDEQDREVLIFSALLHDIGHFPFSHAFEPAVANFIEGENKGWPDAHVRWGKRILNNPAYKISEVIGDEVKKRVIELIDKESESDKSQVLKEKMTGHFSIDRLDYLKRDAYHAGTPEYAIIDADRIINSYIPEKSTNPISIYQKKALYALEGALLSYFYMYRAIYYHHAVRSSFLLFQDILWDAFQLGVFKDIKWEDPKFWNKFDDRYCWTLLVNCDKLVNKMQLLTNRNIPKVIRKNDITSLNSGKIFRLCQKGAYQNKIEIERSIQIALNEKWTNLAVLFLDSPVLIPYHASPSAVDYLFIWDGNLEHQPEEFSKAAPFIQHLEESSEQARVYVNKVWKNDTERTSFVNDLNDVLQSIEEPSNQGGKYELAN